MKKKTLLSGAAKLGRVLGKGLIVAGAAVGIVAVTAYVLATTSAKRRGDSHIEIRPEIEPEQHDEKVRRPSRHQGIDNKAADQERRIRITETEEYKQAVKSATKEDMPVPNFDEIGFAWTIDPDDGSRRCVVMDPRRHTLIAGTTGCGKSVTTNAIIAQMTQIESCALVGVDLKGGIELAPWFPRMSFVATKLNEVDFLLDKLLEENERRTAFLRSQGEKKIKPNKKFPLIICIIDELAEFVASKETGKQYADAKKAAEGSGISFEEYQYPQSDVSRMVKLRRLSALGRSQGIFLIVTTQKPSSKLIVTDFRDNFDQRLCHRVNTASNVTMILGVNDVNNLAPAYRFPGDMPGMMYAKVTSCGYPIQCRSEYYARDEMASIAADTAHLRHDLSFLRMPGYLYRGSVMQEQNLRNNLAERREEERREKDILATASDRKMDAKRSPKITTMQHADDEITRHHLRFEDLCQSLNEKTES